MSGTILQPDGKPLLTKLMVKYPPELDVTQLQKILRAHWKAYLAEKPSLELCKSLIMLRDINISGRINMLDIPVLMHMLQFWKVKDLAEKISVPSYDQNRSIARRICFDFLVL
jgi:hypothetical protein